MVGRTPQRDRCGDVHQPGKHVAEPRAVVQREPPGQQVLTRVVETQPGLHACVLRPQALQGKNGFAQLERVGLILRVEDRAERSTRGQKTVVAGLRFRLGLGPGNLDNGQVRPGPQPAGRSNGLGVIGLQQKPYVQFFPGIFDAFQGLDQFLDQRLLENRDEHRVDGKPIIGEGPGILVGDLHHSPSPGTVLEDQKTKPERPDVGGRCQRHHHHTGDPRQKYQAEQEKNHDRYENRPLPTRQNAVGGICGRTVLQGMTGHVQSLLRGHQPRIRKWRRSSPGSSAHSPVGCVLDRPGRHRITPIRDRMTTRINATPTVT